MVQSKKIAELRHRSVVGLSVGWAISFLIMLLIVLVCFLVWSMMEAVDRRVAEGQQQVKVDFSRNFKNKPFKNFSKDSKKFFLENF